MSIDKPPDSPFSSSEEARESRSTGFVPEFVRKAAVAGLGALFLTEEGLRSLAGQLKLPKEMLGYLASQAERTKDEVTRIFTEELRRFLQSDTLREEWMRLLKWMTVEVKAEVRLIPSHDSEKASPSVHVSRLRTRVARQRKDDDEGNEPP